MRGTRQHNKSFLNFAKVRGSLGTANAVRISCEELPQRHTKPHLASAVQLSY